MMGHSQADKAATHDRIVAVAAKKFRERGLAGVGIAEVMTEAGVTVGGFYKHFEDREQLVAEALVASFAQYHLVGGGLSLPEDIIQYLSSDHRDAPGSGCGTGAMLGEMVHASKSVKKVYTSQIKESITLLAAELKEKSADKKRATALLLMCTLLGAINLSRAVDEPVLSEEILQSVRSQLVRLISGPVKSDSTFVKPKRIRQVQKNHHQRPPGSVKL
jgi:TetR/AcrR family transcriptional repressor of nem operon